MQIFVGMPCQKDIRLQCICDLKCLFLTPPATCCLLHSGPATEVEAHEGYQD